MNSGHRGFIPSPQLEGGLVIMKSRMGNYVLDECSMSEGIGPGSLSNLRFDTFKHGNGHCDKCPVDMFSHSVLLRSIRVGFLVSNAKTLEELNELVREILAAPIRM